MGRRTHSEVRDGSEDPPGGSGRVRGPTQGIWDGSEDLPGSPGWVGGPIRWFRMDRGTLPEVRDGSGDSHVGLRRIGDPQGGLVWVGGPSWRSGTGLGTLRVVRDRPGDRLGGLGRVKRSFRRSAAD